MAILAERGQPAPATAAVQGRPVRLPEFDVMRGVAIIAVVYLHAYFSPWEVTPHRQVLAVHVLHLFAHSAVPAFLFVSGFLMARDRSPSFRVFAGRKLVRVGVPVAVCMVAALAYRWWQEGGSAELLRSFAEFNVSGQFYFVLVLGVAYVGLYPIRQWPAQRLAWLSAAAFAVNLAAIAWYEQQTISGEFAVWAYRNPLIWAFFPVAGLAASRRWGGVGWTRPLLVPGLAAMAAIAAIYVYRGEELDSYPVSYFGVTVFLFSCAAMVVYPALIGLVTASRARLAAAPFERLGRYSFAIYLVHMPFFVGWVSTQLVSENRQADNDYWTLMNGIFAVGFLSALTFVLLVDRVAPRAGQLLLGIEPGPQRLSATRPVRGAFGLRRRLG